MKKLVFVLALLLPFTTEAQEKVDSAIAAEFSLNHQLLFENGEVRPWFFGQGYEYFRTQIACGHWGWLFGEEQYVSGVWGLFCDPKPWLSFGAAVGGENFVNESGSNSTFGRWALTGYIGTEKTNLEYYYENGPSKSSWQRTDLQLWAYKRLAVGGVSQTGDGFGPRLQLSIPVKGRWEMRVWGAPMFKEGKVNSLFEAKLVWTLKEAP
jgi:hypothetical protein